MDVYLEEVQVSKRTVGLAVLVAALAVAVAAVTAGAKVSGTNGRIAFQRGELVFTANPDGSHAKRLLPSHTCCEAWSPDGSKIAIAASTKDGRISTATVNPDGSDYKVKTIPDPTLNLECPAWSPNGRHFACEGWDEVHPKRRAGLFIERTTFHGPPVRLTTNPFGAHDLPSDYSPDGRRLAFWRENPTRHERRALFVVHVSGGPAKRISGWQGSESNTASWSPDGRWILTDNGQGTIYVLHPDGSDRHPITLPVGSRAGAFDPGWSPDGKKIVLSLFIPTGPRSGHEAIYTANADGSNLTSTGLQGDVADWGPYPIAP